MKSRLKIEFYTDNAAFEDDLFTSEVVSILNRIANDIDSGNTEGGNIRDSNGNKIGEFDFYEGE